MQRAFSLLALLLVQAFPLTSFAQVAGGTTKTLTDFINTTTELALLFIPFGALLMIFFWSMAQIVMTSGNAEKQKEAKSRLIWSIIVMFIVLSVGAIIAVVQATFFGENSPLLP